MSVSDREMDENMALTGEMGLHHSGSSASLILLANPYEGLAQGVDREPTETDAREIMRCFSLSGQSTLACEQEPKNHSGPSWKRSSLGDQNGRNVSACQGSPAVSKTGQAQSMSVASMASSSETPV
jgi:hypothetical protein